MQRFRVMPGYRKQAQGGPAGFARAVFPRDGGDRRDVEQHRELGLRAAQPQPDGADLFRGDRFDRWRQFHRAFARRLPPGSEALHAGHERPGVEGDFGFLRFRFHRL